jgi:hypothetical protein
MQRVFRPLAAAAICLAALPLYGASGAPSGDDLGACRAKGQIDVRNDHWVQIHSPKMDDGEGPESIVDFATPPHAQGRILLTNGEVVKVTADAGCTWDTIFRGGVSDLHNGPAQSPVDPPQQDIFTNVAMPTDNSAYIASYDDIEGVPHPHVYWATGISDPKALASAQFTAIDNGMPNTGKPIALTGSMTQPGLIYLLLEGPDPDTASGDLNTPALHLWATHLLKTPDLPQQPPVSPSDTIGLVWHEIPLPSGFNRVQGLQPTTLDAGLWLWSGKKYTYTADTRVDQPSWTTKSAAGPIAGIDVNLFDQALIATKSGQSAMAALLSDAHRKIFDMRLPEAPDLMTHGDRPLVYAITGKGGTWGYDTYLSSWVNITPSGVPAFTKMQMPMGRLSRILIAQGGDSLYRFDTYAGERFAPPPPLPEGWGDWKNLLPPPSDLTGPILRPTNQVVTVKPGELKDVPVDFTVPGDATELDVYFLMDTTGSMQNAINGLKESIRLISSRLKSALHKNACLGLGDFRDYVLGDAQHTYVRDVPISCKDDVVTQIGEKLQNMRAAGGGDDPEAQTIALQQSVTGTGQLPPNPNVDKGQQAGFHAGAFKVIVMVTDSWFKQGSGYPSKADAIKTLFTSDVNVVSTLITTNLNATDAHKRALAQADLDELAAGTQTFAPRQGVDCNNDGVPDLQPGDPLVCDGDDGSSTSIGPAIIGLLLGVTDPGTLAVDVHDNDNVVQDPIKGLTSKVVNLKLQNAIDFALPVMCSADQDGKDLTVGLLGTIRAIPSRYGEVTVRCRATPIPPPVPKPRPHVEPIWDIPRPLRPPIAIAIPNPPPAPAQPITNINLNAGFSQQEEQQFQLAAVTQGASEENAADEELELAMSDHRYRDTAAGGAALGGAFLLASGAAVAHRRRLQRSTRPGYVRY